MKKSTYRVLSKIPFVNLVTDFVCRPYVFCSPGLADNAYDDLFEYMKFHPDVLMTEKLAKEIRSGRTK